MPFYDRTDIVHETIDTLKEAFSEEALMAVLDGMKAGLFFRSYAPTMLVSAKTGAELTRLFKTIERVKSDAHRRIGTGVLNRLFTTTIAAHPPPCAASAAPARSRVPAKPGNPAPDWVGDGSQKIAWALSPNAR